MKTYLTFSSTETKTLAAVLAENLIKNFAEHDGKGPVVLALKGDLGSGKTTFTQGFLRALGVRGRVTSPTFVIMKKFKTGRTVKSAGISTAYHLDAYRLKDHADSATIGLEAILNDSAAVVLVEWPERLESLLPKKRIILNFKNLGSENAREIKVSGGRGIIAP